jgi:tetratricopeptide (TPR) repeat protein
MRRLNLAFLTILVVGLVLSGGAVHLVHEIQTRRNASVLLGRAKAEKRPAKAEEAMAWYVTLRPDNRGAWVDYAELVDQADAGRTRLGHTYLVHQEALRHVPNDRKLQRRCAGLAMELGRHVDAQVLLDELDRTASAGTTAAEQAELKDLLGQCERMMGRHESARSRYDDAIKLDPQRIDVYDRLARLQRIELRQDAEAAATIKKMVESNPCSGRARAFRWRFARELSPADVKALGLAPDDKDVDEALKLARDDREVLLTAAMASDQKRDSAAARGYLERGFRNDPNDDIFALNLARLEAREGRLERAEAVLREAFAARPLVGLAFELADTLILQGKIEGKGQAAEFMALLRGAGLGDTLVCFLEAEVLFQQKKWKAARDELETARAVLTSAPDLGLRLNLMLAECYGRLGDDEQRLEALHRAGAGDQGADLARAEEVRALLETGKLDQAITALSRLAIGGSNPQWRLELVRLLIQKTVRQPRDRRNWQEVESQLREAETTFGAGDERVLSLRVDVLAAQDRLDDARSVLTRSLAGAPRNLVYRLAMVRLAQRQGRDDEALRVIEQAEKDLGPSPRIDLARLDYWGQRGGDAARSAVAKLAAARGQVPAADRPDLLDRLGVAAIRLGRPDLARQYWRELADLQPENAAVRLGLFDLALLAGDRDEPTRLIEEIHKIEGDAGISWRFAQAELLIDQARRRHPEHLKDAQDLAEQIAWQNKNGWVAPTLRGQIAELAGSADEAISFYLLALESGNVQPSFARRLVTLLDRQGRPADVKRVTQVLRDQGAALAEVTIVQALDAIRRRDYDVAVSLARQVYPENSSYPSDHFNLGRIYLAAGRSNEAGKEFRRAVELGPGVPENWLAYVQYLAQANQPDQARAAIEAARKALPPDRAMLTLAQCALAIGDSKGAEALINRAMEAPEKTDDLAALRVAVDVNLRLNRPGAARSYLDRIAASPSASADDQAWANRARAALLLNANRPADREQALTLVDRNLADDPTSVEDQSLKAALLAARPDRLGEAVAILEHLVGINRLRDDQRFLLAQLHLRQGEVAKYEDEMLKLLSRKDKDSRQLVHFVNHWIDRNQFDQGDRWLGELKKADPRGLPALDLEARLLDLTKRRAELLALLEARGREVPDQIGVVADLLNRHGFAREAEAAYKAFIAREPERPERALGLARFLARHDRVAEAMELLEKCSTTCAPEQIAAEALPLYLSPSVAEPQRRRIETWVAAAIQKRPEAVRLASSLGVIYIRRGRFPEAEDLLRKARLSQPDDPSVLNSLAWLLAMRDRGKAEEALQLINHAIDVTQEAVPSLLDTRAVVLIQSGRIDQALVDLTRARSADPKNPNFAVHQAWAYQAKGNTDEARKALKQAKGLGWTIAKCDPLERNLLNSWGRELIQ